MGWGFYNGAGAARTTSSVTFVTSLPATPFDGQEIYYQSTTAGTGGGASNSMADVGAVWHLRYRAAGTAGKKWEFVGGSALTSTDSGVQVGSYLTVANTFNVMDGLVKVTAPLAGDYICRVQSQLYVFATSFTGMIGVKNNATNPSAGTDSSLFDSTNNTWSGAHNHEAYLTVATAGHVLTHVCATTVAKDLYRRNAKLVITPIRVG